MLNEWSDREPESPPSRWGRAIDILIIAIVMGGGTAMLAQLVSSLI